MEKSQRQSLIQYIIVKTFFKTMLDLTIHSHLELNPVVKALLVYLNEKPTWLSSNDTCTAVGPVDYADLVYFRQVFQFAEIMLF